MRAGRVKSVGRMSLGRLGAIQSAELLFILPILALIFWAMVEYVYISTAEAKIAAAAREGARAASMGGSSGDVESAVLNILGANVTAQATVEINFPDGSSNTGDPVQVVVSVPGSAVAPNYLCIIGLDLGQVTLSSQVTMIIQ